MICHEEVISEGIVYTKYKASLPPLTIHVVTIKANCVHPQLIPAHGQREEVSSMAQRVQAAVAINGANYRRGGKYNGNRVNLCCIQDLLYADPCYWRGSLVWNIKQKQWVIDLVTSSVELIIGNKKFLVDGINQPRGIDQSTLYTPQDPGCLFHNQAYQVRISNDSVESITTELPLAPYDGFIYQTDDIKNIEVGMEARFTYNLKTKKTTLDQPTFALGGAGLLLKNGVLCTPLLDDEFSQGTPLIHTGDEAAADFYEQDQRDLLISIPHPRTALGIDSNNTVFLVVVDGRQPSSLGLTLHDLAIFMRSLGCLDAINLGGGGCSTLYCNGKVMNNPCQSVERPVSEALCFFNHF